MGCGKSRVGRLLAQKLNRPFVDTDLLIEQTSNQKISEIFETRGEAHFRKLETETILKQDPEAGLVVSLGGGAIVNPEIRDFIRRGFWVFLDTPFNIIEERVMRSKHRPLGKNPAQLKALYDTRFPIYQEAPQRISGLTDAESICQELLKRIIQHAHS